MEPCQNLHHVSPTLRRFALHCPLAGQQGTARAAAQAHRQWLWQQQQTPSKEINVIKMQLKIKGIKMQLVPAFSFNSLVSVNNTTPHSLSSANERALSHAGLSVITRETNEHVVVSLRFTLVKRGSSSFGPVWESSTDMVMPLWTVSRSWRKPNTHWHSFSLPTGLGVFQ